MIRKGQLAGIAKGDVLAQNRDIAMAGLDATARALRAEHEVHGGVVYVLQTFHVSPNARPIHAQRVARFGHYCTCNCLPPKKLHRDIQ
jgi:hypothetical protein